MKIKLCPYVTDDDIKTGNIENDVCIQNVTNPVNSVEAQCGSKHDRYLIRMAIRAKPGQFKKVDTDVEEVRLDYMLEFEVDEIEGHSDAWFGLFKNSKAEREERRREAIQLLFSKISVVVARICNVATDEVPSSECYRESLDGFNAWKEEVVKFVEEHKVKYD